MRLKQIKLAGFKSFVDPTTVTLPSNRCAVVGPNGCGKSNIVDAVRWVMGESSAKQLRGENLADVIFNGSNSRKPTAVATIELIFDNSDGRIGGEYAAYAEISLRRQVTRQRSSLTSIGGFSGWGGIIYTLTHLGALWNDPSLLHEAEGLARFISPLIRQDRQFDIVGGAAGCIAALLSLHDTGHSPTALKAPEEFLDTDPARGTVAWRRRMPRRPPWSTLPALEFRLTSTQAHVARRGSAHFSRDSLFCGRILQMSRRHMRTWRRARNHQKPMR